MLRNAVIVAFLLVFAALPVPGQETRPATQPSQKAAKMKKWVDELAQPVKISKNGQAAEYGRALAMDSPNSLKAVANAPKNFREKDLLIVGRITEICVKKGCWLRMKEGDEELFVKFKDYSFFVPRHLTGHDVQLEGRIKVVVVSEDERRHLAEDAGQTAEEIAAIKGEQKSLRMIAHAVRISEPRKLTKVFELKIGTASFKAQRLTLKNLLMRADTLKDKPLCFEANLISARPDHFTVTSSGRTLIISLNTAAIDTTNLKKLQDSKFPIHAMVQGRFENKNDERVFTLEGAVLSVWR